MKHTFKTSLVALVLLLAISCKKENSSVQSSVISDNSLTQDLLKEATDLAGNTVKIGTQVWMTKNLGVSRYRNGDEIPQVTNAADWATLTTGAWCWYNNDSAIGNVYGKLYNWYAVNDLRGLAPTGWHIPSDAEWTTLSTFLGGEPIAGAKMKEIGTSHWLTPNKRANNRSGFTALPGGLHSLSLIGSFDAISGYGYWWSSTEFDTNIAWYRSLRYNDGSIYRYSYYGKQYGFSVRCLKN